jgi:hypothetical protein
MQQLCPLFGWENEITFKIRSVCMYDEIMKTTEQRGGLAKRREKKMKEK